MLKSFSAAHYVHGHKRKQLARDCGVRDTTFYKWATGRLICPKHKRQSVDRAFGAKVDWSRYEEECHTVQTAGAAERPQEAPVLLSGHLAPPETPKPHQTAPQSARQSVHPLWGDLI